MDTAIRVEGFPALQPWDEILPEGLVLAVYEDSESSIRAVITGKNPTIRFAGRTHKVSFAWLSEAIASEQFQLKLWNK